MAVLELTYHQMFPEDGVPAWHAGRLPDGHRVHASAIACSPGQLHWAGSVEDADACECDDKGTCNLCLIRQDGGLVFTRVTGCSRSANSAVRALQHWAANPDGPQPPSPFNCGWTTMQAVLCHNGPGAPAMPLGATEQSMLRQQDSGQQMEHASPDILPLDTAGYRHQYDAWRNMMMDQITSDSLDECSDSGHPRQAWLILTGEREKATTCPVCGRMPKFWEKMSGDDRVLDFDYIGEILNETHMASHEVSINDHHEGGVTFAFQSDVFEYAKEWPKPGSNNLTRLSYPGDDAITLRWLRDEWNQREENLLGEEEVLLDPNTREPLTEDTLREYMTECNDEGFSYESSVTDIVNATRNIDDDDHDHEYEH